jgi:hypothetical protein
MIYVILITLGIVVNSIYFKQDWPSIIILMIAISLGIRYGSKNK